MTAAVLVVIAFFSGALPFSVWVGRLALGKDIREYSDGNPGATNVLRAGGVKWGALALLLDFIKGALPVWIARVTLGLEGWPLLAVALAPVLGHAFSPFLRFRGGKAVAVTGGVWCGLTIWEVPTIGGLLLGFWFSFVNESGWAVMLTLLSVLAYLLLTWRDPLLLAAWSGNAAILAWKHRAELTQPPTLRAWYRNLALPWHS